MQSVYPPGEGLCSGPQGWLIVTGGTRQNLDSGHRKLWGQQGSPSLESVSRSHRTGSESPNSNAFPTSHSPALTTSASPPAPPPTPPQASWPGACSQSNGNRAQELQETSCCPSDSAFPTDTFFSGGGTLFPQEAPAPAPRTAFHSPPGACSHGPGIPTSAILLTFSCTEMEEGGKRAFYNQIISVHSSAIMLMYHEALQMVQSQLCWC